MVALLRARLQMPVITTPSPAPTVSTMDAPPEKSTARELVEKAVEGGVGMVPIVGSPAAVAFAYWLGWGGRTSGG